MGMTDELKDRRVAFVIANEGVEQVELTTPWQAVVDAGGRPELLSPEKGSAQAFNHLDKGDVFPVDRTVGDADPSDYDALVLPGGPNVLVTSRKPDDLPAFCTELVCAFSHAGQPA
jgi:protease I